MKTITKFNSKNINKKQYYRINTSCLKLRNDLEWFSISKKNNYSNDNSEETINALIENWWLNGRFQVKSMKDKIKIGDTVKLKSESPAMIVVKVTDDEKNINEDIISCFYWNNIKGEFSAQDLKAFMLKIQK